jgi:pSer/pThr/pTyr-binding forkhead associated (FHA) protein
MGEPEDDDGTQPMGEGTQLMEDSTQQGTDEGGNEERGCVHFSALTGGVDNLRFEGMDGPQTIGRREIGGSPSVNNTVSGAHAQIQVVDGVLSVTDCGSLNGTKVNGNGIERNKWVSLRVGDILLFGDVKYRLDEVPMRRIKVATSSERTTTLDEEIRTGDKQDIKDKGLDKDRKYVEAVIKACEEFAAAVTTTPTPGSDVVAAAAGAVVSALKKAQKERSASTDSTSAASEVADDRKEPKTKNNVQSKGIKKNKKGKRKQKEKQGKPHAANQARKFVRRRENYIDADLRDQASKDERWRRKTARIQAQVARAHDSARRSGTPIAPRFKQGGARVQAQRGKKNPRKGKHLGVAYANSGIRKLEKIKAARKAIKKDKPSFKSRRANLHITAPSRDNRQRQVN